MFQIFETLDEVPMEETEILDEVPMEETRSSTLEETWRNAKKIQQNPPVLYIQLCIECLGQRHRYFSCYRPF